ncbi:MAG: hypothetical protein K6A34_06035 [Methanobrevibacter sp.]|nr:hypothetical protein [Methanobrevibacter sp.]
MKDNNNLLSYNQWSTGEYNNSLIGVNGGLCQISNEFSSIGEYSFKIIRDSAHNWVELRTNAEGNSFTGSCNIYSLVDGECLLICTYTDNTQSYSNVLFYGNNNIQNLSVSIDKNPDKTLNYLSLRIKLASDSFIYMDNPSIILS